MRHHDFREIIGRSIPRGLWTYVAAPEAWIDGRRYRLEPGRAFRGPCDECLRVRSDLYTRADADEQGGGFFVVPAETPGARVEAVRRNGCKGAC
jgi:hypothetical protein